jgi:hypothetical protein
MSSCGRHVRQSLSDAHVTVLEWAHGVAVQVERSEARVAVVEREGEHSHEAGIERLRLEPFEAALRREVGDGDRLTGLKGHLTGAFAELRLQSLEVQGGLVRRSDVVGGAAWRDQGDACRHDREHLDDALDEVVEDALDREVGDHRASEVAQQRR